MQQDRHHMLQRIGHHTSRDASMNRVRTSSPARGPARNEVRSALSRKIGTLRLPPRASEDSSTPTPPTPSTPRVRCRRAMRGAALLDVLFTMTALVAGAQGFAHWQAAGSVSSTAGGAAHKVVTAALPSPAMPGGMAVDHQP